MNNTANSVVRYLSSTGRVPREMATGRQQTGDNSQDPRDLVVFSSSTSTQPINDTSAEVSEVIARMPTWISRGLLYLIVAFIIAAVIWASVAKIDIIAEGRGTLVPQTTVKLQAPGPGLVQNVFVKEGDNAERGQALVQLAASEMRTRVAKLNEELQTSELQLRQSMVSRPVAETLDLQNRIARLQTEIAVAEAAMQHTTLTAPVAGTITTLSVRGSGEVVQPGQTVVTIAPAGTHLVVEAQLANKDIAFVEKGLPAKLKFDAFPFQDYGVVQGTVIDVSPDAQSDKELGSFYKVTILPNQATVIAKGKSLPLRPGLAVSAEIVTERKSILSLLLEPFRKLKSELAP